MIDTLVIRTTGQGLYDFTPQVRDLVSRSGLREGLCTLMIQHTSASLTIQENADPAVRRDLQQWFDTHVPEGKGLYAHDAEGPDDMPAHIKSALTATSLSIPIAGGQPALGTWQGIFLWEHRHRGGERRVVAHLGA